MFAAARKTYRMIHGLNNRLLLLMMTCSSLASYGLLSCYNLRWGRLLLLVHWGYSLQRGQPFMLQVEAILVTGSLMVSLHHRNLLRPQVVVDKSVHVFIIVRLHRVPVVVELVVREVRASCLAGTLFLQKMGAVGIIGQGDDARIGYVYGGGRLDGVAGRGRFVAVVASHLGIHWRGGVVGEHRERLCAFACGYVWSFSLGTAAAVLLSAMTLGDFLERR